MFSLAPYILVAWVGVVVVVFMFPIPTRVAILFAFLFGLLFLPVIGDNTGNNGEVLVEPITIPGLAFSKYRVISLGVLLGLLLRDPRRLLRLHYSWVDVPMFLWCVCPMVSALGAPPPPDGSSAFKDGLTQTLAQFLIWGVPYLVGRQFFGTSRDLYAVICGLLVAALVYVPLCLFEVKMSPMLHSVVYGFAQHDFFQSIRFGGFRPLVFMQHGLAVSMFMAIAAVVGVWLWWTDAICYLPGFVRRRYITLLMLLLLTVALTKSAGAILLAFAGAGTLFCAKRWKTRLPLLLLILVCPAYLASRSSGSWSGADLVPLLTEMVGQERASSFEFRQTNEDMLVERALEGPTFGWNGWGRNLIQDRQGRTVSVPDGLWVLAIGERGVPGLAALFAALLLPVARFLWIRPPQSWSQPWCAAAAACAVIVVLYMLDNLLNNMHNHYFILMAGGIAGLPSINGPMPTAAFAQASRRQSRAVPMTRALIAR
jgi:hypothetical protein